MIRTFVLTLLIATTVSACNQCNVKEGNYTSAGGSEQSTHLLLSADKSFIIKREAWQPGQHEKRNRSRINGTWNCNSNSLTFDYNKQQYKAELVTIGENPLGLNPESQALIFEETKDSHISKHILYPDF